MHVGFQIVDTEKTALGKRCVEDGGVMGSGQKDSIAVRPVGVARIECRLREVQRGENVCRPEPLLHVTLP